MLKTFSHLFGPAVGGKGSMAKDEAGGLAEDESTAPGSGGEDASGCSDTSTEELPPGFDGVPACGAGQPVIADECMQDRIGNAEPPETPVCAQAAPDRVCKRAGARGSNKTRAPIAFATCTARSSGQAEVPADSRWLVFENTSSV